MIMHIIIAALAVVLVYFFFKGQPTESDRMDKVPIGNLTPEVNGTKWCILGQCTAAEDIGLTKHNSKIFSFELTDELGSTIRVVAFREHAETIFPMIQVGRSYCISKATFWNADNSRTNTGHSYELEIRAVDIHVTHVQVKIPTICLLVVPLNRLVQHVDQRIDVLAIIHKVNPIYEYQNKNGVDCLSRDVQLIDTTGSIATLALYGRRAREFDEQSKGQAIGIGRGRVEDYNGRYKIGWPRRIELDPPLPEVVSLYTWYRKANILKRKPIGASTPERMELNAGTVFKVTPLGALKHHVGRHVDILAIVESVKAISTFRNKTGAVCTVREVNLTDRTGTIVRWILGGEDAEMFTEKSGSVLGIKATRVENTNGILLKNGRTIRDLPPQDTISLFKWYSDKKKSEKDTATSTIGHTSKMKSDSDQANLKIVPLNKVAKNVGKEVDVLAIVHRVGKITEFCDKKNVHCLTREVELIDNSSTVIPLILWWTIAREFSENSQGHAILIRAAKVEQHKGRITIKGGNRIEMNPSLVQAVRLDEWYKSANFEEEKCKEYPTVVIPTEVHKKKEKLCESDTVRIALDQIPKHAGHTIDIVVVIDNVNPVRMNEKAACTREIQLIDRTCHIVTWVLLGEEAKQFTEENGSAIAIKGVTVREVRGGIFLLCNGTRERLDYSQKPVIKLVNWYAKERANAMTTNISRGASGKPTEAQPFTLRITPLDQVRLHANASVDILAVIEKVRPVTKFAEGSDIIPRERIVDLVDKTCTKVNLVLWNEEAENFIGNKADIIGIKGAKVSETQGYVFITGGCRMEINPPATIHLRGVGELKDWYKYDRPNSIIHSNSR